MPEKISIIIKYGMELLILSIPKFNGATVEVWECISNAIPYFIGFVITNPGWD